MASAAALPAQQFSECELAIAGVVLDAVLLVFGFGSLIKTLDTPAVAYDVASAVGSAGLDAQQAAIAAMAATAPGGLAMAAKVFGIVQELGSTALPSIFMAAISNLSLLDKALYLGLAGAQVGAVFASGGAWAVPFIGIQLGFNAFLFGKSVTSCYLTCNPGQQPPAVARDAPQGSFIVGQGGRRLVPSSSPDNPRVLLGEDPGTYEDGSDLWDIQPHEAGSVTIMSLAYPDHYIVARQGVTGSQVTVETLDTAGGIDSGQALWTPVWSASAAAPANDAVPGYALLSQTNMHQTSRQPNFAMYGANDKVTLNLFAATPPDDANFLYFDSRKGGFDLSNEFRIGWRLELFGVDSDWTFWNGTSQSGVSLPAQEGTLTRPDDAGYWSVVAMARSSGIANGIAQVRCWSDASGRYIQAGFNAYGTWVRYGLQDTEVSIASDESLGAVLHAWIIPDDDGS